MTDAASISPKEASKLTVDEWREWTTTVWSVANNSHPEHPAVFPLELPHRLVKMFSFVGETVLDPFGGTGTTALAAGLNGRVGHAIEQNEEFVRVSNEILRSNGVTHTTRVFHGDSREMSSHEDESVGLIVTSPPYWDKASYGGGDRDLDRKSVV